MIGNLVFLPTLANTNRPMKILCQLSSVSPIVVSYQQTRTVAINCGTHWQQCANPAYMLTLWRATHYVLRIMARTCHNMFAWHSSLSDFSGHDPFKNRMEPIILIAYQPFTKYSIRLFAWAWVTTHIFCPLLLPLNNNKLGSHDLMTTVGLHPDYTTRNHGLSSKVMPGFMVMVKTPNQV